MRCRCGFAGVCTEERVKREGRGRLPKLCLRNDVGHKSFVISESGLREREGAISAQFCGCVFWRIALGVCMCVCVFVCMCNISSKCTLPVSPLSLFISVY